MASSHRTRMLYSAALVAILLLPTPLRAYEVETHAAISTRAADSSTVDRTLKESLEISEGLRATFDDKKLTIWIEEGSVQEDAFFQDVLVRSLRHFHDPTRDWTSAGFGLPPLPPLVRFPSSIVWGQDASQSWSWPRVRRYYLDALTSPEKDSRDKAFGRTFRGLGQLMHLVQDAASPAHTRNDPHVFYNYESLVREVEAKEPTEFARWLANRPPGFDPTPPPDPAWPSLRTNPVAPLSIARLIDTERYKGLDPDVTMQPLIGLSEYASANFFSEDRIFRENAFVNRFPFPARSSVRVQDFDIQLPTGEIVTRQYYNKVRDGDTGYRLATVGFLRDFALRSQLDSTPFDQKPALDEAVYRDYAERLIPRAASYSTALLDYFFRGTLDLTYDTDSVDVSRSRLIAFNRSELGPLREPLGAGGTLTIYTDDAQGVRTGGPSRTLAGPVATDAALPSLSVDPLLEVSALTAVYRGPLGNEPDAVIGKVQTVAEVEQIFRGPTDWMLRTADGIFPLGLGLGPGRVKWGDRDNTLLTQTFPGGNDMLFAAYQINRPEGSTTVPLRADPLDPTKKLVDLAPLGPPVQLGGTPIDLATTVTFNRSVDFAQELVTVNQDGSGAANQILGATVYPFAATFRLSMPLDFPRDTRFFWSLRDFALNRDGDVVGLVLVSLVGPPARPAPVFHHKIPTGPIIEDPTTTFALSFNPPITNVFVFVVNLTRRTVIAKSCEDTVTITFRTVAHFSVTEFFNPKEGTYTTSAQQTLRDPAPVVGESHEQFTTTELSVPGLYRAELQAAGFGPPVLGQQTTVSEVNVNAVAALRKFVTFGTFADNSFTLLEDVRRANGPAEGYLLLGATGTDTTATWRPLQWTPARSTIRALPTVQTPAFASVTVADASRGAAMLAATVFFPRERTTHLVTVRDDLVFPSALRTQVDLLEPNLLFNVTDLHFHRITPALEPLAAPRPLFGMATPSGEYHVVGRR